MKRLGPWLGLLVAAVCTAALLGNYARPAQESMDIDLTQRTPPDIATVANDPFGKMVKYGYTLFTNTANELGPAAPDPTRRFAGNNLTCQQCHLRAGSQPYAMPLVGVWGQFPQYRAREAQVDTLEDRINGCMERSMNGHALPAGSREMKALLAFMRWLSSGIPDGVKPIGAGTLQIKEPERAANLAHGAEVFSKTCAACHGADGLGQHAQTGAGYQFPPLWGPDSFNNGAGMNRLLTAAAYAKHNMPIGTTYSAPLLTDEEAFDVAGYLIAQTRPEKANLDKDFPVQFQKPIDTPYGPFADGFGLDQHKFGPFGPIRRKVMELAAALRIRRAGAPDNESDKSDDAQ